MPDAMVFPQSVIIEGILYVYERGGGLFSDNDILRYDLNNEQWCERLGCQYRWCGMTTVSSQLVMVGGVDVSTHKRSKTVQVYSP